MAGKRKGEARNARREEHWGRMKIMGEMRFFSPTLDKPAIRTKMQHVLGETVELAKKGQIEKEIGKIGSDSAEFKIVQKGVGPVSEGDVKNIGTGTNAIVIGFNVKADKNAIDVAEKNGIVISFFDIIYKMAEWLTEKMEELRPKIETTETVGQAKILKAFSRTKERQILGGKVVNGRISMDGPVKIMRREFEIGRGKIVSLEKSKVKTREVEAGSEFGMMLESKIEVVPGDVIESFSVSQK